MIKKSDKVRNFYIEKFDELHNLLAGEKSWIQTCYAGIDGKPVIYLNEYDPRANCFCLMGGITRIFHPVVDRKKFPNLPEAVMITCFNIALDETPSLNIRPIVKWNDIKGRTQKEVLDLITKTKELVKTGEVDNYLGIK